MSRVLFVYVSLCVVSLYVVLESFVSHSSPVNGPK